MNRLQVQSQKKKDTLLETLRAGSSLAEALSAAGISKNRYYSHRHKDNEFAEEVDQLLAGTPTKNEERVAENKKLLIEALDAYHGVVTDALRATGVSPTCYYGYLGNDPEFARAVEDVKEQAIDFVETQLFKQIEGGNHISTIFYLKTRGKKRGYTESVAVTDAEGGPIQVRVIEPWVDPLASADRQLGTGTIDAEYEVIEP